MNAAVTLIARREIVTRLQQRGYRLGFVIALVVVAAVCAGAALIGGDDSATAYDVAVTADGPAVATALHAVGRSNGVDIIVHRASPTRAAARVRSGDWDAALLPGNRVLAEHASDAVVGIAQEAQSLAATTGRLRDEGLTPQQVRRALDVAPTRVRATASGESTQRQTIGIIAVVLLFSQLITFCTWVATGVVEEKSSRVVELILASVRPLTLLTGKLVGIGVLAAGQVLALGLVAAGVATAAGTITIPASAFGTVAVAFVGFLLGYAFFAALAAALASTVSRQEEVSGILAPVTIGLTVCYGASFAVTSSPDSGFARVLSIIPPFSAIAMPARVAGGGVPPLNIALAAALLVLTAIGVLAVAARIYRASVLHSGTRVSLRTAWRGEAVGLSA